MKEQLYTIPVNDAFNEPCECPLCKIYDNLEQESIDFMLELLASTQSLKFDIQGDGTIMIYKK